MAQRKQTKGKCTFCEREMTKGGLTRHLPSCTARQEAIEEAAQKQEETKQDLYHLQVYAARSTDFWLHLEMKGSATLQDLDAYLRSIWLECCGHLSRFSRGGWGSTEISKSKRADQVFEPGVELTHIYDFGTSSETDIKAYDVREGYALNSHPIFLMARNDPPETECMECEQSASWLCMECVYEMGAPGTLCDEHADAHPHYDYGGLTPLVNSPRVGMCGYDGPATPPY